MRYLRICLVRVQGEHPNKADNADDFECLYCRAFGTNKISGTIPDVAALTNLNAVYAAMPVHMACTCVA
eukprot:1296367-Pleurochrysis_carterae.AAC.1